MQAVPCRSRRKRTQAVRRQADEVPVPVSELAAAVRDFTFSGRLDIAEQVASRVLAGAPRHPESLYLRGLLALRHNRLSEAADYMEQARGAGADSLCHLCDLALVYSILGRRDEAAMLARRARARAPDDMEVAALARDLCR